MLIDVLLVFHIAVLGYWLGSELVINSTYRYVSYASGMPFDERKKLMEHVLDVDQHVRYALILQASLGTMLAALFGYIPGGDALAWVAAIIGIAWLTLVEVTHRRRHDSGGESLARIDRGIRYVILTALLAVGATSLIGLTGLTVWLAWKLTLFAGVIACGVGIRLWIIAFFKVWHEIEQEGSTDVREQRVRYIYVRATSVLGLLWLCIAGIVILSVWKPG